VYGKGQQRKPFISLEHAVEGLAQLAVMNPDERPDDHVVYNQVTRAISIVEMGTTIAEVASEFEYETDVKHFENPRDEDETHKMKIENDRYMKLIDDQSISFEEAMRESFETLVSFEDRISAYEDRFLPGVLEE
jgi:nucleoside-diphosphate-sugar epimerase